MVNTFLLGIGVSFAVWVISQVVGSYSWSKFSKQQHEFLYGTKSKAKVVFWGGVYKFSEASCFVSMFCIVSFLMLLIFELCGV